MMEPRQRHGMGVISFNEVPTLVLFGGDGNAIGLLETIEEWNDQSQIWERSKLTMNHTRMEFGFATLPTGLVCV